MSLAPLHWQAGFLTTSATWESPFRIYFYTCVSSLSHVQLFVTPWTVAYEAALSMGFSRQEYWSGLPFPSPGDLSDPGIKLVSSALQAYALPSKPPGLHIYTRTPLILPELFIFNQGIVYTQ